MHMANQCNCTSKCERYMYTMYVFTPHEELTKTSLSVYDRLPSWSSHFGHHFFNCGIPDYVN